MIAIRSQIATAVRWANVVYERLGDDQARDTFAAIWDDLERKVTAAEAAGDIAAVETALTDWRQTVAGRFEEATK
ncbi:MAG TPA: hypothetical protein PKD76_04680 [Solirubrobacterales bacterium]|nr:hypothetical protein [Solirubrobacterales bacterium]